MELTQSQTHGFRWENEIKAKVFGLVIQKNNTDKHDISCSNNKYNPNETVSIKTAGNATIDCGDILRFYDYDFTKKHTICCVEYSQVSVDTKRISAIYEIDYTEEMRDMLFGSIPKQELIEYRDNVKKIPNNIKGKEAKQLFNYLEEKKGLQKKYNMNIRISPKVDSKQSRVQCSIPKFKETLKDYIVYKSCKDKVNIVRGIEIALEIVSRLRVRNKKLKI